MPRTHIKICGFRDAQTLLEATERDQLVDLEGRLKYYGLNCIETSPRYIPPDQTKHLIKQFEENNDWHFAVDPVLLFANHTTEHIIDVACEVLDGFTDEAKLQLHGDETPDDVAALPTDFKIIKAVPFDLKEIERWRGNDRLYGLLIDAPKAKDELGGGTGRVFDWQALADLDKTGLPDKLFLAGGLTPNNVGEAIRLVRPYAVDVASGVESSRGVKDVELIKAFCKAVFRADSKLD